MTQSSFHDKNGVPTLIAIESDGKTIINVLADPSLHELNTSNGTSGSDNGPKNSRHDASHVHILMATSNLDGITPIPIYADSSGNLLIESI